MTGAWIAGTVDTNQYVEIDMTKPYKFRQVHIQGRDEAPEWVTTFKLHYDDGSGTFLEYTDSGGNNVSRYVCILLMTMHINWSGLVKIKTGALFSFSNTFLCRWTFLWLIIRINGLH